MTSINTSCAQVVQELRKKGKKVYSIGDVTNALIAAGCGSVKSVENYSRPSTGHLIIRGFMNRVPGGYELTESSMVTDRIVIELVVKNELLTTEIVRAISKALTPYRGIIEV